MLGIPIESRLQIEKESGQVNPYDLITLAIINRTDTPIIFPNSTLGLEAFKYDPQLGEWSRSELALQDDSEPYSVQPSKTDADFTLLTIAPQWRKDTGTIRFVIVGSTNPSDLEGSKIASYVDINIQSENPSFFGNWINQNGILFAEPVYRVNYAAFSFEGNEVQVSVQEGPTNGAMELEIDGVPGQSFCNYSETTAIRTIKMHSDSNARQMVRLYPIQDMGCNNGQGSTGVVNFESK